MIAESVPNLMRNINLLTQYSQINLSKINVKKAIQHHIMIKMLKINDKEKILKAA